MSGFVPAKKQMRSGKSTNAEGAGVTVKPCMDTMPSTYLNLIAFTWTAPTSWCWLCPVDDLDIWNLVGPSEKER